jgi:tRNA (uracil-5-)-methyltransferase
VLRNADLSKATRNDLVSPAKVEGCRETVTSDLFDSRWSEHLDDDEITSLTSKIFPEWLRCVPRVTGFQSCPVHQILASPVVDGYRNKIELTFGTSPDGQKCVGNRLGSYSESVHVMPINTLRHVTTDMKLLAAALSAFASSSGLDVYDIDVHEGVWRNVTFRQSTVGSMMVCLVAAPPKDSAQSSLYASELERFVAACLNTTAPVISILVQEYEGLSAPPPNYPFRLLHGSSTLDDVLCEKKFEISAGAFFQVNSAAATELFGIVRRLASTGSLRGVAGAASTTALLDICCGTGAIGIICSAEFARVVGVELSEPAVEDARRNAAANGLANVIFVAAKAEEVMKNILEICAAPLDGGTTPVAVTEVVAIVDPPRAGLHPSIIRALRTSRLIHRLVYVSCNPAGSFLEDAVKLCCPPEKNSKFAAGPAFKPVLAVPVDMFPDTPHCELVTLFERKA